MSARWIDGIPVDRARLRFTATYALLDDLMVGLEANPLGNDYGLLANWRAVDETERRPALILGTSSDRIGTPTGRAYYATLSKDLEHLTELPIAPYAGVAYGEFESEWRPIGGLVVRWAETWNTTHLYDGVNLHHILDHALAERYRVGLVVVQQGPYYYLGFSAGASF